MRAFDTSDCWDFSSVVGVEDTKTKKFWEITFNRFKVDFGKTPEKHWTLMFLLTCLLSLSQRSDHCTLHLHQMFIDYLISRGKLFSLRRACLGIYLVEYFFLVLLTYWLSYFASVYTLPAPGIDLTTTKIHGHMLLIPFFLLSLHLKKI